MRSGVSDLSGRVHFDDDCAIALAGVKCLPYPARTGRCQHPDAEYHLARGAQYDGLVEHVVGGVLWHELWVVGTVDESKELAVASGVGGLVKDFLRI